MAEEIEDGTGTGNRQKVDGDNRAHVQSLSIPYEDFSVLAGESFAVGTQIINLTSDGTSYLLYVSNDNTHDLVLSNVVAYFGESDASGTDTILDLYLGPTGGTLISGGATAFSVNNNLGSPNTLDVTATTGTEGSTATGGFSVPTIRQTANNFSFDQKIVVPPGTTFALGVKPPTGNGDMDVVVGVTLIRQTLDTK